MTAKNLMNWLKAIETAIPPPMHCHHAITYAQFGSDDCGWEDKLALQINLDGKFLCFFLEDYDFEMSIERFLPLLTLQIANLDESAQLGIGMGKYIP